MRFALIGYGKMGREIGRLAAERGHVEVARVDAGDAAHAALSQDVAAVDADVAFEFTAPEAAAANVERLVDNGIAVVCGTTGWQPAPALAARARAAGVPVLVAPNFSLGMTLFYRIVREAARQMTAAGGYEAFLTEMHHRGKLDAPSGTAMRLAEIVRQQDPSIESIAVDSADGGLAEGALHVSSVRAGAVPGTHTVGWDGPFDTITLEHRARSRSVFAIGAIQAAEWLLEAAAANPADAGGVRSLDALIDWRTRGAGGEKA